MGKNWKSWKNNREVKTTPVKITEVTSRNSDQNKEEFSEQLFLHKLPYFRIQDIYMNWFKSYLSDRPIQQQKN